MGYEQIDQIVARLEAELLAEYPVEAPWLILLTPIWPRWGGGYNVLGLEYRTLDAAADAQRSMVMQQLAKIGGSK